MSCVVSRGNFPAQPKRWPPRLDLRRLTPEQVARIRAAPSGRASPPARSIPSLSREFGITPVAGWKVWKHITYRDLP